MVEEACRTGIIGDAQIAVNKTNRSPGFHTETTQVASDAVGEAALRDPLSAAHAEIFQISTGIPV
jgi:hypothetical protein